MKFLFTTPKYLTAAVVVLLLVVYGAYRDGSLAQYFPSASGGSVLSSGKGSGGDGDSSGNEDEDDEDDEDDNDEAREEEEDEVENEIEDEAEDDQDEVESEDQDDEEEETKTRETIQNADGTTSEIRREVKKDGESKVRIRTFSPSGFKVEERRLEEKSGETKLRVESFDNSGNKVGEKLFEAKSGEEEKSREKTFDAMGNTLTDLRLETKEGKEVVLKVKEGGETSKVKFDVEKQELVVGTSDEFTGEASENQVRIRAEGDSFVIRRSGIGVATHFPMTVDEATGDIMVETPHGSVVLGAMPDSIVQKVNASGEVDVVTEVELESSDAADEETDSSLQFVVTGQRREKLLGFMSLNLPTTLTYDAQTGDFLKSNQSLTTKILDLFSF